MAWLALRRSRLDCLHLFGKFTVAGVDGLVEAIELEKKEEAEKEKEKENEKEETNGKEAVQQDQMDTVKEAADEPSGDAEVTMADTPEDTSKETRPTATNAVVENNIEKVSSVDQTSSNKMDVDTV